MEGLSDIMKRIMGNRAAIYVRTSSEHQGQKSSPMEQESDCRQLATGKGLVVTKVYRDIKRYRIKTQLVEPSGTRSDRPGLLAMLNAAARGEFDIILAWREDRLYRGMQSMLLVLETIRDHKIAVMLARETFDFKIAPLRAWLAQMELDGMKERMTMGVKARLRAGKANTGRDRYGYQRIGEKIIVVEEEAKWVRQIFEWYLDGCRLMEIRDRLIAYNAPQKGSSIPRRIRWARSSIQSILIAAKAYASGIKIQSRKGERFEIPVDPIIDMVVYERFVQVRASKKTYRVNHVKFDFLIGRVLYCACGLKWAARTQRTKKNKDGVVGDLKIIAAVYYCRQNHLDLVSPDCPRHIGAKKAEAQVWEKICEIIDNPQYLIAQAHELVDDLRAGATKIDEERTRIEKEIEALVNESNELIAWARRGSITRMDMEQQLSVMSLQELSFKHELSGLGKRININSFNDWEEKFMVYLADLQACVEQLKIVAPQNDEERHSVFLLKRQIVDTFLHKATIDRDRKISVEIRLNLLAILEDDAKSLRLGLAHIGKA
jgi:DNA invertase Pin-like site-specific DNA recombinase